MLDKISRFFKPKQTRPYKLFQIEATLQCGLACVMCPWSEIRAQAGAMTWDTFQRIAGYFHLAESVDLTGGGEPLTHPQLVDMVAVAKQAGCSVGFSTNGVHLTFERAEALLDLGLDWISFSVDAATAEVYERIRQGATFATVMQNIAALRDLKAARHSQSPTLMMVFVMMGGAQAAATGIENFQQLPEYVALAHQLGVEQVIAKNLDVILKANDDQRRLFTHDGSPSSEVEQVLASARRQAEALGVGLRLYSLQPREQAVCEHNPLQNVFFNWEGHISPCITLSYAEQRVFDGETVEAPCLRFGNIRETSLEAAWHHPEYRAFRQALANRQHFERQALFDSFLDPGQSGSATMPAAPVGCQTCYYLYGI